LQDTWYVGEQIEVFTAARRPWEDKNERRVRGNMVMAAAG
jgi:hypothetical protein